MNNLDLFAYGPIWDIQDHWLYANNGNIIGCYRLELPEPYGLSENGFDRLHSLWTKALSLLPPGTMVHRQDLFLGAQVDMGKVTGFLSKATAAYFQGRPFAKHTAYVFFIQPIDGILAPSRLSHPFRRTPKNMVKDLDARAGRFQKAISGCVDLLASDRSLDLFPMSREAIFRHSKRYLNGFSNLLESSAFLEGGRLRIGDFLYGALSLNNEDCFGDKVSNCTVVEGRGGSIGGPGRSWAHDMGAGILGDHLVNQIFLMDTPGHWERILADRITGLQKSVNFGHRNRALLKKALKLQETILEDPGIRLGRGHYNIMYWERDMEVLRERERVFLTEFHKLDLAPYLNLGRELTQLYLNSHPCHGTHLGDRELYVADLRQALCLGQYTGGYRSDRKGICFTDRLHNIPTCLDLWDAEQNWVKARNFMVFAPTGEGKSFLVNHMLRQYLEIGVRMVIIDLGGSYSKMAHLYPKGSLVVRYRAGHGLGINPFRTGPEGMGPGFLEGLCTFLSQLFGSGVLGERSSRVALKKLLAHYYQNSSETHCLSGFHVHLRENGPGLLLTLDIPQGAFDLSGYLHLSSEYVEDGLYAFLFRDGPDNSGPWRDARLVVFELDEADGSPEILSILLLLIQRTVHQVVWKDRSSRGIVLFDEFAKQLKYPKVLEGVEYYYQAIRKQEGAIGTILQSVSQLPINDTAASILDNTQLIFCLHNDKGYRALVDRLGLSGHEHALLQDLRNGKNPYGRYTEIFIKQGRRANIYRLEVPPEVHAAYLTDGPRHETIMGLFRETGDMEKAIRIFLEQEKQ
ncbi:VirB4 family type IV secretion system protein [Sediminicola luteus]|uniref:TraG P-loop domain-containing protein n=1 Tax=Sediminicola luteus TaxID=319238 RepID=A0A2A4G4U9_9FLAO|nr:DUF87 domain-containing protein [Sediminicola luteus]PCE63010.1 hypothetical protein B7P33_17195 [Sediminicola luteus]